ncbi:SHOCT domain-containing protein [Desulfitobacterium hafniense]|uniref:SHOCT domain-containing protein n=1 Tax=bioreactor metagenome TaxID=1076179 RepID=A0A644U7S3_9ZZZZ|nr:SHOCT domain-containing protein [Desulfitobacterium hafniense]MEA5024566.1 SHOCT domain-containing protein [Desulfitobacterium hafniense]
MFGGWGCSPFWSGGFWGIGLLGMSMRFIFWILLIALVVYFFRKLGTGFHKPAFSGRSDASSILRERYARGEIDSEEYGRRKEDLNR